MGSIEDISQLCRLCLVKDQVNIPIFDETSDIGQTFLKINSCLPVKVSRDDNLPKKICDGCSYKLDMLYIFRNTSVDSEKQLISWLNQAGLSTISQTAKDPLANAKPEITVKQETFDSTDSRAEGDNTDMGVDAHSYIMQQQQLPYQQDFDFGEPSGSNAGLTDEPAPKRAKRAAALKKAPLEEETEDVDDDLDAAMQITKAEEEDSEDIDQPDYVEAPSTSADDQPGPSGVGKAAVEAPSAPEATNPSAKVFTCRKCNIGYPSLSMIRSHRLKFHWKKKHSCHCCSKTFKTRTQLRMHTETHTDQLFKCDECDEIVRTSGTYYRHKAYHRLKQDKWKCCGRNFRSAVSYQKHYDAQHGKEFPCELCDKTFTKKEYYKIHRRTHEEGHLTRFRCEACHKTFAGLKSLERHIQVSHQGKRFLCDTCGKEVTSEKSLKNHVKIHTDEKSYVCSYCGKRFSLNKYLQVHLRVHTKERPYGCKICDKKYSQQSSLGLHIKAAHTGEKPYTCIICAKSFISKTLLNGHMKSHFFKDA